ncbi:hypothetical protein [Paraburkholderia sp. SIMBA_054]|uniref:hypothetical protein n=1 Tax=Paraburkholderia sp. SIMBA_054 TaxID=3085795 RepID=UPI0039787304
MNENHQLQSPENAGTEEVVIRHGRTVNTICGPYVVMLMRGGRVSSSVSGIRTAEACQARAEEYAQLYNARIVTPRLPEEVSPSDASTAATESGSREEPAVALKALGYGNNVPSEKLKQQVLAQGYTPKGVVPLAGYLYLIGSHARLGHGCSLSTARSTGRPTRR